MGKGSVKYWGRMWLEYTGVSMGIALALMVFLAGGRVIYPGDGINGTLQTICVLYPTYLVLSGIFILTIGTVSAFQTYLPILLSLNATRRGSVWGILGYNAGCVLAITAVIALFWLMPLSEVENVSELLLLILGILLMFGGVGVLMGAVVGRFGKKGMIISAIFCTVLGGGFGGMVAVTAKKPGSIFMELLMNFQPLWVLILGAGVYVLAGTAAMMLIRKMEARA
ncbi:hypothetical protein AALA00_05665 [Lachnospiraceae bacterium 46-15]